jgi:transposase
MGWSGRAQRLILSRQRPGAVSKSSKSLRCHETQPRQGNGAAFAKGRDFAAWLGLVPKQMSTGDRTILGRISKRGNRYLRTLLMQGARVILLRPANWAKHSFGPWLTAAANRLHHNVLVLPLLISWRGSPGPFWRKVAATKHASSREQRKRPGST